MVPETVPANNVAVITRGGYDAENDREGLIDAYRKLLAALPADVSIPNDVKERMRTHAVEKLKNLGASGF